MYPQKVVEQSRAVSKEEDLLKSSLENFCSLLPSSNINQIVTVATNFDKLVTPFMEKPHLLDRTVKDHMEVLVKEVKDFVLLREYHDRTKINAILTVIYSIIRVRGRKAAVAYFPNDVFLLTPFIHFMKLYDERDLSLWQPQFVLLFWISLLLLSPFDLSSIQEANDDLAADLYNLSILYMHRFDPVGEVASEMLSLFLSRKDISQTYILPTLQLLISQLNISSATTLCNLLCLKSFLKHSHDSDIRDVIDYLNSAFVPQCEIMINSPSVYLKTRILLLKILSQLCIRRLQLLYSDYGLLITKKQLTGECVQDMVEIPEEIAENLSNCISILLSQLQESSILLREKVSSYICNIGVYLPSDFCDTVINEVMELMETNNSLETIHGCCYTLAAALANRVVPPDHLIPIIDLAQQYVVYQLAKKTASTTAVVRDSACYILWSLVRSYPVSYYADSVQNIISSLIMLAIADTEINPRRAAAAVIQEIVGRMGAEHIPSGISLINILHYNSLAQIQHIYNVVIPELACLPDYEEVICNFIKWTAEKQENITLIEHTSKALQYVIQHIPNRVQSTVMDPLIHQDWSELSFRSLVGTYLMLAACMRGLHMKKLPMPSQLLSILLSQFQKVIHRPFSRKQGIQIRPFAMALLHSLTYFTDDFFDLFCTLFPLKASGTSGTSGTNSVNDTRQFDFTQEEQCLLVCSQWFYRHKHTEGIQYCKDLVHQALVTPTEHSVHLFGALYYKINTESLDVAISLLTTKQDAVVLEALAVVISRLLLIQPVDDIWTQRLLKWLTVCCSCYIRDFRGDVGSWTRSAAIKNLPILLDKLFLSFPQEYSEASQRIQGMKEYVITPLGVAQVLNTSFMEYLPLTEGSTLFPALITSQPELTLSQTSCMVLPESLVEAICRVVLKQMAEQHTVIRTNAHSILNYLLNQQYYTSSFMQHLQSCHNKDSILQQLMAYLEYEDLASIVLSGLIFVIGGNTPVITEEATNEFTYFLMDHDPAVTVHLLLKILKNEYEKAMNGFYPALKTVVICAESVNLIDVVRKEELDELSRLIIRATCRYRSQVAVLKSLLELLHAISELLPTSKELVNLFLPFLSSSYPFIREEASQILYVSLTMKTTQDEIDEQLIQVIGESDFAGSTFEEGIKQLQSLLQ